MKKMIFLFLIFIPLSVFGNGQGDQIDPNSAQSDSAEEVVVQEEYEITPITDVNQQGNVSLDSPYIQVKLTELEVITTSQFESLVERYEANAQAPMNAENKQELADYLVSEILIDQAAKRDGITVSNAEILEAVKQSVGTEVTEQQLQQYIEQQMGVSYQEYMESARKQLLQQRYITTVKRALFESIIPPSDEQIEEFFNENASEFLNPELVRFSQVFFDIRNLNESEKQEKYTEALGIKNLLEQNTVSFEEMVRLHSEDPASAARGGDFGFLPRDDAQLKTLLGNEFFQEVFNTEKNTIKIVTSTLGYHIIKVTEHLDRRLLELDDAVTPVDPTTVREYIAYQLYMQSQQTVFQRAANQVVEELKSVAEITISDAN